MRWHFSCSGVTCGLIRHWLLLWEWIVEEERNLSRKINRRFISDFLRYKIWKDFHKILVQEGSFLCGRIFRFLFFQIGKSNNDCLVNVSLSPTPRHPPRRHALRRNYDSVIEIAVADPRVVHVKRSWVTQTAD